MGAEVVKVDDNFEAAHKEEADELYGENSTASWRSLYRAQFRKRRHSDQF